jgi:hypothetical protein
MTGRGRAACGASTVIVLGAVSSAFINGLDRGWQWWAGAGGAVFVTAAITYWLALRSYDARQSWHRLDPGAVRVTGSVDGDVDTLSSGPPGVTASDCGGGDYLGSAAVLIEGDVRGRVRTKSFNRGIAPGRRGR